MGFWKKMMIWMLCGLLVVTMGLPARAAEEGATEANGPCTLRIHYFYEELPLTGARFQIFRVGGVDAYGQLYLDGNFAGYPVDLTTDDMAALARMLYGYAMVDNLPAEYEVTINERGEGEVTGMPEGVYLVIGLKHSDEVNDYLTEPQLVILPAWNAEGVWTYETTLNPKGSVSLRPVKLKVLKQWNDEGNEHKRPASITVTLLRDGEVYDTVVLTAENNWRHTWEELPGGSLWTVVEDVPEGYTVFYSQEGITYLIVNTCDEPPPPPPTVPEDPELPDTGLLWWPVPVMVLLGLALIVLGVMDRRGERYDAD